MKIKFTLFFLIISIFSFNCKDEKIQNPQTYAKNSINGKSELISALYWYKFSAEKKAIYLQNFNFAKEIVKNNLNLPSDKPLAVITDIDETVLDNSDFEIELIQTGKNYTYDLWKQWTDKASAQAQPGAVEFSKFLQKNNVELFYISNRRTIELESTLKNLQKYGFAYADTSHLLLKTNTSDKTDRRNKIFENYNVILFLGDNLRDFDEIFKINPDKTVDSLQSMFGSKFIIFPNPLYGDWQKNNDTMADMYQALIKYPLK